MRVALVNMPFASASRPSLALGLLQSLANRQGHACTSKYFNTLFARMLGFSSYSTISDRFPVTMLCGEWVFSQAFYGRAISSWDDYDQDILSDPSFALSSENRERIKVAHSLTQDFLELCLDSCDWSQYQLVGFTSTFEQTMASMSLARMIKKKYPSVMIVMGGANFEAGMAEPYLHLFPFLDYICHGEGDISFLQLCEAIQQSPGSYPPPPPGFISRFQPERRQPPKFYELDSLPYPDFDDFFHAIRHTSVEATIIPMEAARGCWWGEKSHCTFCGLNGMTMRFRQKTPNRVAEETSYLATRYQPQLLSFSDNILSRDYMKNLLPAWAADIEASQTRKFFEVKSNMTRDELILLKRSGIVQIQPGIESLVDGTLRIMGKGVSAAHNIALLRWCAELGIDAGWNILYGFPGEDPESFSETTRLVQSLSHLNPPQGCYAIRVDRFSPNYERWREHGFHRVIPLRAYAHVFDADDAEIAQLAYFFDYEHAHTSALPELSAPLREFWATWNQRRQSGNAGELSVIKADGLTCTISDTRFNRPNARWDLTPLETTILLLCDQPISRHRLPLPERNFVEDLLKREFLVECGGKLVSLPLIPQPIREQLRDPAVRSPRELCRDFSVNKTDGLNVLL